jgi:methyl-accepting chemotaxis protein
MGVIFLGIAVIVSIIAFSVNYNHRQFARITDQNARMIQRIDNTASVQDNLVEDLLTLSQDLRDPRQKVAIQEFSMDHYSSMAAIRKNVTDTRSNIAAINTIIRYNNILLILIIAVVILQGAALYYIGIKISHRFTGPLVLISRFLRDYIEGRNPTLRPLRREDELQEFYDLFAEAVETVKTRERELRKEKK